MENKSYRLKQFLKIVTFTEKQNSDSGPYSVCLYKAQCPEKLIIPNSSGSIVNIRTCMYARYVLHSMEPNFEIANLCPSSL